MPLFNANIDLDNNQLQNAVVHSGSTKPSSGLAAGQIFYDTDSNQLQIYTGSDWEGVVTETKDATTITDVTSILNTSLVVGRDATDQIKFSTNNQIIFRVDGGDGVIFKGSGEIEATSLDISGDADIAGALTLGTALAVAEGGTGATSFADKSVIITQDSGTDTLAAVAMSTNGQLLIGGTSGPAVAVPTGGDGLTVTVGDGALEYDLDAALTTVTSILATDLKIGEDDQTKIDFETADTINFYAGNEKQLILTDGALTPGSNAIVDLGTDALEFKDAYFDGTVEADAITIGGTNILTGGIITTLGSIAQDTINFTSSAADDPMIVLENNANDATGARILLLKDKGAAGADGDEVGEIIFAGDNDAQQQTNYAKLRGLISDASDGSEGGKFEVRVATHDGEMQPGLTITDGSEEDELDVILGNGANSTVTIPGNLIVTGETTTVNVTTTTTSNGVVFEGTTGDGHDGTLKSVVAGADVTYTLPNVTGHVALFSADPSTTAISSTPAELNILDGDTSATSTTIVDADRVVVNDAGTMKQVTVAQMSTYYQAEEVAAREIALVLNNTTSGVASSDNITYVVTHNFGTRNVMVEVYRNGNNSGNYQTVYVDVTRSDDDDVTIVFGSARTAGDYTAILRKIG